MIEIIINIMMGTSLAACICMLVRNEKVHKLSMNLIGLMDEGSDNYTKQLEVYHRYTYTKMLYSFRSIASFRKEFGLVDWNF